MVIFGFREALGLLTLSQIRSSHFTLPEDSTSCNIPNSFERPQALQDLKYLAAVAQQ